MYYSQFLNKHEEKKEYKITKDFNALNRTNFD